MCHDRHTHQHLIIPPSPAQLACTSLPPQTTLSLLILGSFLTELHHLKSISTGTTAIKVKR